MRFSFTAAAGRALDHAAAWTLRADDDSLSAETLLVGLLGESECRAAAMLRQVDVDVPAVCRQWPDLRPRRPATEGTSHHNTFSTDVDCSLQLAAERLRDMHLPPELATESILLGLAAADHEVGRWLRRQGLDCERIEAEIRALHGCPAETQMPPLDFDETSDSGGAPRAACTPVLSALSDKQAMAQDRTSAVSDAAETAAPQNPSPTAVLRVLDAAANRAREALRVIEDHARFVLDDRFLTEQLKQLRHDLAGALENIPAARRMASRETLSDVGTQLDTPAELRREETADILRANFARAQEALRSLEEFGKLLLPSPACGRGAGGEGETLPSPRPLRGARRGAGGEGTLSAAAKQLRYRVYTIERAVMIGVNARRRLDNVNLCVLIDARDSIEEFQRLVGQLVSAGVPMIQLRDKRLADRELLVRARLLSTITRETSTLCIVNDRPDLAALARADGVHVGQEDISIADARRIVGPDALVGASTHDIAQARRAVLDGADYIGVGPTFPSATKQFEQLAGVELLRAVAAEIGLPAFAIGGITADNLTEVLASGFSRVALSAAVAAAADPVQAAKKILDILHRTGAP
jgi:thiamine-phosphate pyrophosphorylase